MEKKESGCSELQEDTKAEISAGNRCSSLTTGQEEWGSEAFLA